MSLQRPTAVFAVIAWVVTGLSISAGYHRHFTHNSFQAIAPLRAVWAVLGAGSFMGSIQMWAAKHLYHHALLGTRRDPYDGSQGSCGTWMLHWTAYCSRFQIADSWPGVNLDHVTTSALVQWQHKYYLPLATVSGLIAPAMIGSLWGDALGAFVYAGLLRILLVQHQSFLCNSLGHTPLGTRHYSQSPTYDSLLLSLITFGEGYTNYHFTFPGDYRIGPMRWHVDPTKWVIRALSWMGLTYSLRSHTPKELKLARINAKAEFLAHASAQIDVGPPLASLPVWSWDEYLKQANAGSKSLVAIDDIVYDVTHFIDEHPGGVPLLKGRLGTDATAAFNGAVYRHSKAARNLISHMRAATIDASTVPEKQE